MTSSTVFISERADLRGQSSAGNRTPENFAEAIALMERMPTSSASSYWRPAGSDSLSTSSCLGRESPSRLPDSVLEWLPGREWNYPQGKPEPYRRHIQKGPLGLGMPKQARVSCRSEMVSVL